MPLWAVVFVVFVGIIRYRGFDVKPLGRALFVEVVQAVGNSPLGLVHRFVCTPANFFLLEGMPEALHVHAAQPAALAVH